MLDRRDVLAMLFAAAGSRRAIAAAVEHTPEIPTLDRAFLADLERRCFLYFWEQTNPSSGLVLDRSGADGGRAEGHSHDVASAAACGFGLAAMCIGAERGWITRDQALGRVRNTLQFFATAAYHNFGWFYHWMDFETGERRWDSEVSSIDTAFLLGGVLTARKYFSNVPDIPRLADTIYNRVDFEWMLNGDPFLLSHGWKPAKGFLKPKWDTYSELPLLYLLAVASPTHPIAPKSWYAWQRPLYSYGQFKFISGGPLFTHQYSHAWIDFRNRFDRGFMDFFQNSVHATRANRLFCMNLQNTFPDSFGSEMWGATASDSPKGYKVYGEIPNFEPIDGTIAPCGPGGSLMFTPDISIPALRGMRERFGDRVYRRYGFVDAFNLGANWFDSDVVGIDVGITLLSAENLLTGNVWRWFMAHERISQGMELIGFTPLPEPEKIPPNLRKRVRAPKRTA